jgi:hypothetical protein
VTNVNGASGCAAIQSSGTACVTTTTGLSNGCVPQPSAKSNSRAPDDEDSDAVDDVAQVAMVGLGQPDRRSDARVGARELDDAASEPCEQVLEAGLVGPGDVPIERDRRAGCDLAQWMVLLPGWVGRAAPSRRCGHRHSTL